jgi:hypothetical protein
VYLTHCYAHTSDHLNFLPNSLKGADMAFWNTAKALNLNCEVVPIMYIPKEDFHLYEPEFNSLFSKASGKYKIDEYYQWPGWGHKIPEYAKITWLNNKKKALGELQVAYATVSAKGFYAYMQL